MPTHHTADKLSVDEQEELQKRLESEARKEREKKDKTEKKETRV